MNNLHINLEMTDELFQTTPFDQDIFYVYFIVWNKLNQSDPKTVIFFYADGRTM